MPLLENQLRPLAQSVADFLCKTGGAAGSRWEGYTKNERLSNRKREKDDAIIFYRRKSTQAQLIFYDIIPVDPDPKTIVFHDPIILESKIKSSVSESIHNKSSSEQSTNFNEEFKNGENEENAIKAGLSVASETSIEAGGEASQFKVSQTFTTTLSTEWSTQTGISKENTKSQDFPLIAAPYSYIKGFLQWNEQTLQRRIECDGAYDFKIKMGRMNRYKKYDAGKARKTWRESWSTGSPVYWGSLLHLIAVAEKRGQPSMARYDHYANMGNLSRYTDKIKKLRLVHIDRITPKFKGATGIEIIIEEQKLLD